MKRVTRTRRRYPKRFSPLGVYVVLLLSMVIVRIIFPNVELPDDIDLNAFSKPIWVDNNGCSF